MGEILGYKEEEALKGLQDKLNDLSKDFPTEYTNILKKSQNFTVSGVLDVVSALTYRGLEVPQSLYEILDISKVNKGKIGLKENVNFENKLTLKQSKDVVNGWVQVLQNISSIHDKDSKSLSQDISNKDKKESMQFLKLSKQSLKKLKSVIGSKDIIEDYQQKHLIYGLKKEFPELKNLNLEWEIESENEDLKYLNFTINNKKVFISFNKKNSKPFKLLFDSKIDNEELNFNSLILKLKKLSQNENKDIFENNKVNMFLHGNLNESEKESFIQAHKKPPIDKYIKYLSDKKETLIIDYEKSILGDMNAWAINGKIENIDDLNYLKNINVLKKYNKKDLLNSHYVFYSEKEPSKISISNEVSEIYMESKLPEKYKYIIPLSMFQSATLGIDEVILDDNNSLMNNFDKNSDTDWDELAKKINNMTQFLINGYQNHKFSTNHKNFNKDLVAQKHATNLLQEKLADLLGIDTNELKITPTIETNSSNKEEIGSMVIWKNKN
jgi:hypothetical protein